MTHLDGHAYTSVRPNHHNLKAYKVVNAWSEHPHDMKFPTTNDFTLGERREIDWEQFLS